MLVFYSWSSPGEGLLHQYILILPILPVTAFHRVPISLENWINKGIARMQKKQLQPSCFDHIPPQNWTGISHFLIGRAEQLILAKHKIQNPEPSDEGEGSCKSPWQSQRNKQLVHKRRRPQNVHGLQVLLTGMCSL